MPGVHCPYFDVAHVHDVASRDRRRAVGLYARGQDFLHRHRRADEPGAQVAEKSLDRVGV